MPSRLCHTLLIPTLLILMTVCGSALATTPAGTRIANRATVHYQDEGGARSLASNWVTTEVTPVCGLSILPNGSVAAPGQSLTGFAGETVALRYVVSNTGNATSDYPLEVMLLTPADFIPETRLILDSNGNGVADPGEDVVTELRAVPAGATVSLLLLATLPKDAAGDSYLNLRGGCTGESASHDNNHDSDNVGHVRALVGGVQDVHKEATPAAGSPLYPGAVVRYAIGFRVGGQTLHDTTVSDPLSEWLTAPSSPTDGRITDPAGAATEVTAHYDAASHTLRWHFATLPAGMTVRLEFTTTLRPDAPAGVTLGNTAFVGSQDLATPSERVEHPLLPLALALDKTARPARVAPGERIRYTLVAHNPGAVTVAQPVLTDTLPAGLRYVAGSSRLLVAGEERALEPQTTPALVWTLPPLAPDERITVQFEASVESSVLADREIINSAGLSALNTLGEAAFVTADSAVTAIDTSFIRGRSVLLGTAFTDEDGDGVLSQGDTPVPSVRLYLPSGAWVATDAAGRYVFLDLYSGVSSVKVDPLTLPARALAPTPNEAQPGLWPVRLFDNLVTRQDIPFVAAHTSITRATALSSHRGPVEVRKWLLPAAADTTTLVQVRLELTTTETVTGLVLHDPLPAGAQLVSPATSTLYSHEDGVVLELGTVTAGSRITLHYTVAHTVAAPHALPLRAPDIRWELP